MRRSAQAGKTEVPKRPHLCFTLPSPPPLPPSHCIVAANSSEKVRTGREDRDEGLVHGHGHDGEELQGGEGGKGKGESEGAERPAEQSQRPELLRVSASPGS